MKPIQGFGMKAPARCALAESFLILRRFLAVGFFVLPLYFGPLCADQRRITVEWPKKNGTGRRGMKAHARGGATALKSRCGIAVRAAEAAMLQALLALWLLSAAPACLALGQSHSTASVLGVFTRAAEVMDCDIAGQTFGVPPNQSSAYCYAGDSQITYANVASRALHVVDHYAGCAPTSIAEDSGWTTALLTIPPELHEYFTSAQGSDTASGRQEYRLMKVRTPSGSSVCNQEVFRYVLGSAFTCPAGKVWSTATASCIAAPSVPSASAEAPRMCMSGVRQGHPILPATAEKYRFETDVGDTSSAASLPFSRIYRSNWAFDDTHPATGMGIVWTHNPTHSTIASANVSWNVAYDPVGRITGFNAAGDATSFTYDANGNRTSSIRTLNGQTTSRSYSAGTASNQLTGFTQTQDGATTSVAFGYNANGDLISDGLRSYSYNAEGRLSDVTTGATDTSPTTRYAHNALGQRVFKTEPMYPPSQGTASESDAGFMQGLIDFFTQMWSPKTTDAEKLGWAYVYDEDGNLISETGTGGANSTGTVDYIYLPTANGAMPIAAVINGKIYAISSDHLNTPRRLIDQSGQVVWQWAYSAFGDTKPTTAHNRFANLDVTPNAGTTGISEVVFNLRYSGMYRDQESGLAENGFRSYRELDGRYTQPDPIGLAGGPNKLTYVGGDPLNFMDPLGLDRWGSYGYGRYLPATNPSPSFWERLSFPETPEQQAAGFNIAMGFCGGTVGGASKIEGLVYRASSGTPASLTPRAVDVGGLSAADSLSNALSGKNQLIDTSRFSQLCATCDNAATGHVSIAPRDMRQMQDWINSRGGPEMHPLTQELIDAVVGTVKK